VTANRNSRHQRALKGSLRHAAALVGLEDRRLSARRLHPLVNVRCGVLVDDYVHRRRKLHAAAEVIWVRVRIDDGRDRVVGQLADLVNDRLPPLRVFPVHDDHTRSGDKDSRVTSGVLVPKHEEVVPELLDLERFADGGSGVHHRADVRREDSISEQELYRNCVR
jgi:hypothetical protein